MRSAKVLLLEDEFQLAKIVKETLQSRGFIVTQLNNGRLGLEAAYRSSFDICVVDVMMPFMDGFTFVKEFRKTNKTTPVLFLTARSQDDDVIEGYTTGGNDYLKKPFSLEELLLRINELLRRNFQTSNDKAAPIIIGGFRFYPQRQELIDKSGQCIKLSFRETELLFLLAEHKNQILDRKATLLKLWGDDNQFHARTMDVFITKLRKHLQTDTSIGIINVRGYGYKLLV